MDQNASFNISVLGRLSQICRSDERLTAIRDYALGVKAIAFIAWLTPFPCIQPHLGHRFPRPILFSKLHRKLGGTVIQPFF